LHIIYGLLLFWQSVAYLTIRRQGSDKDKKKENSERDERAKKVCITFKAFFPLQTKSHETLPLAPVPSHLRSFSFLLMQSVSINEFLKPAEGQRYYSPGGRGRGRGRGRGDRGGFRGGYSPREFAAAPAPAIQDQSQFPSLGGKWRLPSCYELIIA
jgi:plasminogen activator inhibitor 1 RNA-binding protein